MRDLPEGFISESVKAGQEGGIPIATLNADERKKRVIETIKALGQLRYGANLTKNLSDVTPVAIIIGFLDGGNAPFQRIFKCSDDGGSVLIDTPRFSAVLSDFKNRMLDVETPVIFGALPGIITNEDEIKKLDGINYAGSAVDAISMAVSKLQNGNWPNSIWG
jgi:CRISPR-associated protein Cst2